jgi:hypothetical protein
MSANGESMKIVYTVVERGPGKSYWTRVGVGFVNRDGSLNLRLDAIPMNGMLQVRDWEERDGLQHRPNEAPSPGAIPRQRPRDGLASTADPSRGASDTSGGLA